MEIGGLLFGKLNIILTSFKDNKSMIFLNDHYEVLETKSIYLYSIYASIFIMAIIVYVIYYFIGK